MMSKTKGFMAFQEVVIITHPLDTRHNKDTLQLEATHLQDTHPVHTLLVHLEVILLHPEAILLQAILLLTMQDILVVELEV